MTKGSKIPFATPCATPNCAPTGWAIPCTAPSPAFVNELPAVCFQGVDLWAHGHTHDSFDYRVDRPGGGTCRVVCNPRGYVRWDGTPENRGFDPERVVRA